MKSKFFFPVTLKWSILLMTAASIIFYSNCLLGQRLLKINKKSLMTTVQLFSGQDHIADVPVCSSPILLNSQEKSPGIGDNPDATWTLKFSAPGKVFKDISFANPNVGYIVTELGAVYKSTNGGNNWTSVLNLGFPYYWYGVHALSRDTVIISGFNNSAPIKNGVVRWSYNGGTTWQTEINLTIPGNGVGWLDRVHFFNADTGIVVNSFSGGCWYTTNGGKTAGSWNYITINSDLAWTAGNIDAQSSGKVFVTGIHFARSTNFGYSWTSGPSADPTFDGGIDFLDDNNMYGWTGGGQISAPVSGWVCRTTNSGTSWSTRLMVFAYPIRSVRFLDENRGWAIGGNLYDEAGGIYFTTNGGLNWNQEVNSLAEMFSIDLQQVSADSMDVWCVGSTGSGTGYTGKLYKTRIGIHPVGIIRDEALKPDSYELIQNYPNPFNVKTTIEYKLPYKTNVTIKLYDLVGTEIKTLYSGISDPGNHFIQIDGSLLPDGVYFYQMITDGFFITKRMIISK